MLITLGFKENINDLILETKEIFIKLKEIFNKMELYNFVYNEEDEDEEEDEEE